MSVQRIRRLADTVLLEGYALYPYRASSRKNRFRWAFGVLAPRGWSEAGGCEPWWLEAQCVVQNWRQARLSGALRFLHIRKRRIEQATGDGEASFVAVDALDVDGRLMVPWEEGEVREIPLDVLLSDLETEKSIDFEVPGHYDSEQVSKASGEAAGRIVRQSWPLTGKLRISLEILGESPELARLSVRAENLTDFEGKAAPRDEALKHACISSHLMLTLSNGSFISLLDPPESAKFAAEGCRQVGTYPVLAGDPEQSNSVLAAPIILYDFPTIAPESPGDFFDATEIDELLTLRTLTLTDEEKRLARATDQRSCKIVDRVEQLGPEAFGRLHGARRELRAGEMVPQSESLMQRSAEALQYERGTRVRLKPGARRTDAQDFLFAGHVATVEAVLCDVDDREYLAVTVDDDPASDLHRWYGRYLYYYLDEVEFLAPAESSSR